MRIGNQTPRIRIEPKSAGTDGKGAAMLMQAYGVKLDEWQELIINGILATDENGRYVCTSVGFSLSRQQGKSEVLIARCFYGLVINGERIVFSSHQMRACKKIFHRLVNMFTDDKHPEIKDAVKQIRYGIGEESILLKNGGSIEFMARSRQAGRGFDGISLLILDEAQEVTTEQMESLSSILSSSKTGTRQIIYAGTPPYPGCPGDVFKRYRTACLEAEKENTGNTSSAWYEWSPDAETMDEIDVNDVDLYYQCNPGLGIRLSEDFTREELKSLGAPGFIRERLGYWAPDYKEQKVMAIDAEIWDKCASSDPKPTGKTAYGVKFSKDGAFVAISGAVIPDNGGPARISLIQYAPTGTGIQWLVNWLNERYKVASCVVIDGKSNTDYLITMIRPVWLLKQSVIKPNATDMITASAMLANDLIEQKVTWYEKQTELRESAITSTKRNIGGGWGFDGDYCTPIESAMLALWGARTTKRNPQKKMLIG